MARIFVCLGYLAPLMQAFLGDGARWGVAITPVIEESRWARPGACGTIDGAERDFFVVNGDTLTDLELQGDRRAASRRRRHGDPLHALGGRTDRLWRRPLDEAGGALTDYAEKPRRGYHVCSGVYVLSRRDAGPAPARGPFDMPDLIRAAMAGGHVSRPFPAPPTGRTSAGSTTMRPRPATSRPIRPGSCPADPRHRHRRRRIHRQGARRRLAAAAGHRAPRSAGRPPASRRPAGPARRGRRRPTLADFAPDVVATPPAAPPAPPTDRMADNAVATAALAEAMAPRRRAPDWCCWARPRNMARARTDGPGTRAIPVSRATPTGISKHAGEHAWWSRRLEGDILRIFNLVPTEPAGGQVFAIFLARAAGPWPARRPGGSAWGRWGRCGISWTRRRGPRGGGGDRPRRLGRGDQRLHRRRPDRAGADRGGGDRRPAAASRSKAPAAAARPNPRLVGGRPGQVRALLGFAALARRPGRRRC